MGGWSYLRTRKIWGTLELRDAAGQGTDIYMDREATQDCRHGPRLRTDP